MNTGIISAEDKYIVPLKTIEDSYVKEYLNPYSINEWDDIKKQVSKRINFVSEQIVLKALGMDNNTT